MNFIETIENSQLILTEGSVIERIKREFNYPLDEYLSNSTMIYKPQGKEILNKIYREYIEIIRFADLPMIILSPTWRANSERIKLSAENNLSLKNKNINADNVEFLKLIRNNYGNYSKKIFIGGLLGCRGDAYSPNDTLNQEDASNFHKIQINELAAAGVDFQIASTLPALSEAQGIAKAMSETSMPYIISFVIRENGCLLDGVPLSKAISFIDETVENPPLKYMVNCVHPSIFLKAITNPINNLNILFQRLAGLQANSSAKSPEELDGLDSLDTDEPNRWAMQMFELHKDFNMKILGGCCGTNGEYIRQIINGISK